MEGGYVIIQMKSPNIKNPHYFDILLLATVLSIDLRLFLTLFKRTSLKLLCRRSFRPAAVRALGAELSVRFNIGGGSCSCCCGCSSWNVSSASTQISSRTGEQTEMLAAL